MKHKRVLLVSLLAACGFAAQSAHALSNWVGTADYTAGTSSVGDEDVVGPFSTFDAGAGVVLLEATGTSGSTAYYNGFYQSYVTNHELFGTSVAAPNLNSTYELTLVSSFQEAVDTTTGAFTITGGTFDIFLDTTNNRSFSGDSGFTDGDNILSGTITGGNGTSISVASMIFGVSDINIQVTSFDSNVFEPDTITDAGGIFTLRLNNPYDAGFLNGINSVQGHTVDSGDFKFAADGYMAMAVPEANTYAMMLAGLGLVGFMARRSTRTPV